jgi:hypothetical protein
MGLASITFSTLLHAWAAPAALGDNSVGMNIHVGYSSFVDASADLGVKWVRLDGNWRDMEPSQGSYRWFQDDSVTRANAKGLKVFMTLAYTPSWVARHGDTDGEHGNDVPNTSTEWTSFVTKAVQHYRPMGVTHFGLWNEPNLRGFFEGSANEYVDIIAIPGAAAIRAACADCKVLGPDLANVGEADVFLEAVMSRAPLATWDIVTHHIYQTFREMGTDIWDGDSFINALEDQRFFFTRRSLRQVLDGAGWTGEVWITETGYEAEPAGDAGEESRQEQYVRLVLEAQLGRAWWTNTFFYEIADCGPSQPGCPIDGFGLMRANSGGADSGLSYPGNYRRKPAFTAIKQFIQAHPEITGTGPAPQCGDGVDNDQDGLTDGADPGCHDAVDDNESDDPPRPTLDTYRAAGITVDGNTDDFGPEGAVTLDPSDWRGTEPLGNGDLAVTARARWSPEALYLAFDVTDDVHDNTHPNDQLWMGDSVQVGLDPGRSGGTGYDRVDDQEINFALVASQPRAFRFHGPAGATTSYTVAIRRTANATHYEIALPPATVPGLTLAAGTQAGFSFLVNDADGNGRVGWLEFTPGIGTSKVPGQFGRLSLLAQTAGGPVSSSSGTAPASSSGSTATSAPPLSSSSAGSSGPAPSSDGAPSSGAATSDGPPPSSGQEDPSSGAPPPSSGEPPWSGASSAGGGRSSSGGDDTAEVGCRCAAPRDAVTGGGLLVAALLLVGTRRRRGA